MQKGIIYKITNKVNNKVYVGCTITTLEDRYKGHLYRCFNKNYDCKLYNSMRKYGKENFKIDVLEECNIESIYEIEKKYIELYSSYENGLNSTLGGEGCLGYIHSEEKRKKISKNLIDSGNTHKNKTYEEIYGDLANEEKIKRKFGVSNAHKNMSDQDKQQKSEKISESLKGRIPWNKGLNKQTDDRVNSYSKTQSLKQTGIKKGPYKINNK